MKQSGRFQYCTNQKKGNYDKSRRWDNSINLLKESYFNFNELQQKRNIKKKHYKDWNTIKYKETNILGHLPPETVDPNKPNDAGSTLFPNSTAKSILLRVIGRQVSISLEFRKAK